MALQYVFPVALTAVTMFLVHKFGQSKFVLDSVCEHIYEYCSLCLMEGN
jgi:hypothetical protein